MKRISGGDLERLLLYFLLILASIIAFVTITNFNIIYLWLNKLMSYLSPFIAGAILAYLLNIPCSSLEKLFLRSSSTFIKSSARGISVLFTFLILIAIIVLSTLTVIPIISKNIAEFIQYLPYYYENTLNMIDRFNKINSDELRNIWLWNTLESQLTTTLNKFYQETVLNPIDFNFVRNSILKVLNLSTYLINTFIAIISSVYLLLDAKNINLYFAKLIRAFMPDNASTVFFKYLHKTNANFKKFLYCNTLDGIIIGIASIVGIYIIGAKYSFALGLVEGVTNMIPYFGAVIGTVFVVIIVLITSGVNDAILVAIFLFILQQIDGNIIKPKLFGDSFSISPFLIILSITLGGIYYGVIGMVIAIPLAAVIKNIIDDILEYRISKKTLK